jgi:predicted DNA-binding transcriptional regulator AlpA
MLVSIDKRTSHKLILVPELCQMTGLTDSMRANFQLMKEMALITNANAT